jgi:signal transduction histidine kinase
LLASLLLAALSITSYWATRATLYSDLASDRWSGPLSLDAIPFAMLLYPFYSVLCFFLSLDALRHPATPGRMMGEVARRRARPWLTATALVLMGVSLLVTGSLAWLIGHALQQPSYLDDNAVVLTLAWLDLAIAGMVAAATLLLGQAVTSYEIFTGKTLPRRGLSRHWRSAVVLATGYGLVVGWSLALQLHPIYGLLLATILMVVFYALFSWRSYVERERYINHLRPFVASQRLYEDVVAGPPHPTTGSSIDAATPFHALCRDVLGTRTGYLAAVGPLSPLVGPPLTYSDAPADPGGLALQLPLSELTAQLTSPQTMCVPVDAASYNGAQWAVPLWSERGLTGILLLGKKRDGGLYTQEEIEIARASGERLIDTQASVAMAQRLMGLQRQRLAESQVLDRRARRVLHDDVLPLLHTSMLMLNNPHAGASGDQPAALALLADAHRQIADLLRDMPSSYPLGAASDVNRLGLIGAMHKMVTEEFGSAFDCISWDVQPEAAQESENVAPLSAEVLFYAVREVVRNAARHGRGSPVSSPDGAAEVPRPLHLKTSISWSGGLKVVIEDNGVGMQAANEHNAGSGHGLALHGTLMAVVGGTLSVESVPGKLARVVLMLPQTPGLKEIALDKAAYD